MAGMLRVFCDFPLNKLRSSKGARLIDKIPEIFDEHAAIKDSTNRLVVCVDLQSVQKIDLIPNAENEQVNCEKLLKLANLATFNISYEVDEIRPACNLHAKNPMVYLYYIDLHSSKKIYIMAAGFISMTKIALFVKLKDINDAEHWDNNLRNEIIIPCIVLLSKENQAEQFANNITVHRLAEIIKIIVSVVGASEPADFTVPNAESLFGVETATNKSLVTSTEENMALVSLLMAFCKEQGKLAVFIDCYCNFILHCASKDTTFYRRLILRNPTYANCMDITSVVEKLAVTCKHLAKGFADKFTELPLYLKCLSHYLTHYFNANVANA